MGEQLELFIGHPPGDESGKTKIVDAMASSSWNVNFNTGNVNTNNRSGGCSFWRLFRQRQHEQPPEREPGSSPRRNR